MKKPPAITQKPPTKAQTLAATLLAIQIEQLEKSPTLRKSMGISLTSLKHVDKIRKSLQGQGR